MKRERSTQKKASQNGQRNGAGFSLQAPAFCRPACRRRGSQIIEYAIVIAAIAAAFTTMFVYGKRGLQATIRTAVDKQIGSQQDGSPAMGYTSNEMTVSHFDTLSTDNSHMQQGANGTSTTVDSFSSSSGTASATMNE